MLALLALAAPVAPLRAQSDPITVFVVRHAEKGPGNPNPDLTEAGTTRAAALAHALGDAEVTVVITSEFKRTQATGAPLAAKRHLTPEVIDAGQMDPLMARLKALPGGSRALVVSHSNLVAAIVEKLSGRKVAELTDADYDRLYAVTLWPDGKSSVLFLHYGAPAGGGGPKMTP
jgi:broad specificity phosphatase PhoE